MKRITYHRITGHVEVIRSVAYLELHNAPQGQRLWIPTNEFTSYPVPCFRTLSKPAYG